MMIAQRETQYQAAVRRCNICYKGQEYVMTSRFVKHQPRLQILVCRLVEVCFRLNGKQVMGERTWYLLRLPLNELVDNLKSPWSVLADILVIVRRGGH